MFNGSILRTAAAACAIVFGIVMLVQRGGHDVALAPGVIVVGEPRQESGDLPPAFERQGYLLAPVAHYEIRARLLSAERYARGREAELSPIDFAVGWNNMSDSAVLTRLKISQSNRFYFYRWEDAPPLPPEEIVRSSANMHLIPASPRIRQRLEQAQPGAVVHLRGVLVDVSAKDGWSWRTSRTRLDSGAGACEVMWVEDVEIEQRAELTPVQQTVALPLNTLSAASLH